MKYIGIWIDKRKANIVSLDGEQEQMQTITSEIEEFHPKGGSGSRMKGGPQDVVQDGKYLAREKQQFTEFFQAIVPHLNAAEAIVVFGPSQTGQKLKTELKNKHPHLHQKISEVRKADSMTDNQVRAWVREYFAES